jgi:hypothetical protein
MTKIIFTESVVITVFRIVQVQKFNRLYFDLECEKTQQQQQKKIERQTDRKITTKTRKTEKQTERYNNKKQKRQKQRYTNNKVFYFLFVIHPKLQRPAWLDNLKTKEIFFSILFKF